MAPPTTMANLRGWGNGAELEKRVPPDKVASNVSMAQRQGKLVARRSILLVPRSTGKRKPWTEETPNKHPGSQTSARKGSFRDPYYWFLGGPYNWFLLALLVSRRSNYWFLVAPVSPSTACLKEVQLLVPRSTGKHKFMDK